MMSYEHQLHPRQAHLLGLVRDRPWSFRELVRASEMQTGTASHHLAKLSRYRLVEAPKVGIYLVWHVPNASSIKVRLATLEDGDIDLLKSLTGGQCQKEILATWPEPRSTTQHRLQRLVRLGMLREKCVGRYEQYEVVA